MVDGEWSKLPASPLRSSSPLTPNARANLQAKKRKIE
uniref:Uncharacterized protein n=1 Tax=Romanomermis culicivorax TaxID=13658 RepID=A0A915JWL8_ROMCU